MQGSSKALAPLYRELALRQAPRILGLGDREAGSETHGCFDRGYWHYRLVDFPNAQQQQVSLYLAILSGENWSQGAGRLRDWALAAVSFWSQIQHVDGSFDEAYPNERGFCATAMSTAAVSSTLLRLAEPGPRDALVKAGRWVKTHTNPEVSNQEAAAALALLQLGRLLGEPALTRDGEGRLDGLLARQDPEGFFPEYGGQDVGYQSITLGLLARCHDLGGGAALAEATRRGCAAILPRVDEWGRHDPGRNSRRTQYLYPSGLVAGGADDLLQRHAAGVRAGRVLEPGWLDDRYVAWLATDYLLAAEALRGEAMVP